MDKCELLIIASAVSQLSNMFTDVPGGIVGHQDKEHLSGKPLDFSPL